MKGDTIARVRRQQALRDRGGAYWPKPPPYAAIRAALEAEKNAEMRRMLDAMPRHTPGTLGAPWQAPSKASHG